MFDSCLELHIEQAPVLDRERCNIGIVVGGYKTQALKLTISGDTGHAGGTPMAMRRNALVGAGYVIAAVNDVGLVYAADEGRTTTTRIESFPNLPGTYAEQVKLTIDFRHIDPARFQAMRSRPSGVRRAFLWTSIRLSQGKVEVSTTSASSAGAGWTTY